MLQPRSRCNGRNRTDISKLLTVCKEIQYDTKSLPSIAKIEFSYENAFIIEVGYLQ